MFALKGRRDAFKITLPKEFICPEIEEKYETILKSKNSFYHKPIDFLNETIQTVQVFGFENGTFQQQQSSSGIKPLLNTNRYTENAFQYPHSDYSYRAPDSPINIIDKTLNITFRHTLGYLNYFLLFENFFYQFTRDRYYKDLIPKIVIDIFNEKGSIYSRILLDSPLVNSMDMLDFDYSQPVAQSDTFKVEFKYSNFDFEFLEIDPEIKSEVQIETGN